MLAQSIFTETLISTNLHHWKHIHPRGHVHDNCKNGHRRWITLQLSLSFSYHQLQCYQQFRMLVTHRLQVLPLLSTKALAWITRLASSQCFSPAPKSLSLSRTSPLLICDTTWSISVFGWNSLQCQSVITLKEPRCEFWIDPFSTLSMEFCSIDRHQDRVFVCFVELLQLTIGCRQGRIYLKSSLKSTLWLSKVGTTGRIAIDKLFFFFFFFFKKKNPPQA